MINHAIVEDDYYHIDQYRLMNIVVCFLNIQ